MNAPVVAAIGIVDREGIAGTAGTRTAWQRLDTPWPGDGRTFRAVFGRADETFRRLDVASRMLVLACEALGLDRLLPRDRRDDTALVVETTTGCLDADLQFAASLHAEMRDAPIFPYTLPSTCLGEIALRHELRGASVCLPVAPVGRGRALAEARRLLALGEAPAAVVAAVDVLDRRHPMHDRHCDVVAALLVDATFGLPPCVAWPGHDSGAFAALARALRT